MGQFEQNGVVKPGMIGRYFDEVVRLAEQAQREQEAANPSTPYVDNPIVSPDPLLGILRREANAELDAHFRRFGRMPSPTIVRDERR
jgi:hypothetical protein